MPLFEALGVIIKVLPDLIGLIKRLGEMMKEKQFNDWIAELDDATRQLEKAQSISDRVAAARKLSDLVRRM